MKVEMKSLSCLEEISSYRKNCEEGSKKVMI